METVEKIFKIIGKVLKYTFIAIAVFVVAFPLLRIATSGDTAKAKAYLWTDSALAAYKNSPDTFSVYEVTVSENFTHDGAFFVSNIRYSESGDESFTQFQLTVRYNDSTLKYLKEEQGITELPEGEIFFYYLVDNHGNRYDMTEYISDRKQNYNYRRIAFDGVDMTDVQNLTVEIYYAPDMLRSDQPAQPYRTLVVYKSTRQAMPYQLKKNELPVM